MPAFAPIAAKGAALFAGWGFAMLAPLIAIALWKSYGGTLYAPEIAALIAGHILNAGLSIALACAAAAVAEHPATAAIVTLSVTAGAWVLDFIAAVQGGLWETAAGYTPSAMVARFQHGLVKLDVVLIGLVLIAAGLCFAAIWLRLGVAVRRRAFESAAALALAAAAICACSFVTPSWDLSENRENSFPEGDEQALRRIHRPLRIVVHLAQEDPRRVDLERRALSKLRRVMPEVRVQYSAATSIGLFEQTLPHYGEIWYEMNGKTVVSRVTTAEGVLEAIYSVAGIAPPPENGDDVFRGHPLAAQPTYAAAIFYGAWPCMIIVSYMIVRRRIT